MATIHEMHPQTHLLAAARPRPEAEAPLSSSPVDCSEEAEALSWAMLAAAVLGGFVAGMLVTAGLVLLIGLFL